MKKTFDKYQRKELAELRPVDEQDIVAYNKGMMKWVSVSQEDFNNGSPKIGDMIARNPKNHKDQWLVAKQYFEDNFDFVECV